MADNYISEERKPGDKSGNTLDKKLDKKLGKKSAGAQRTLRKTISLTNRNYVTVPVPPPYPPMQRAKPSAGAASS